MDYIQIVSLALDIVDLLSKETFSKQADNEIRAAERIARTLPSAKNSREEINRILAHFESAFAAYETCMYTIDIWDWESIMFKKAGKLNMICESIAELHYQLGNTDSARQWLLEHMRDDGSCNKSISFYEKILGLDYERFRDDILLISEEHRDSVNNKSFIEDREGSGWGPWFL